MRILSRKDIISGLVTGLTTGIIVWRILVFLGSTLPLGIDPVILPLVVPFLWVAGVQFGYFLGTMFAPFIQFGRFVAIGFSNAAVDFGVLYVLIGATGHAAGVAYTGFKAISATVATVHSYYWNKNWAFEAATSGGGGKEAASFVAVTAVSLLVNVTIATIVVALKPSGFAMESWAGIGAIAGAAAAIIFSFTGFRVFVFKKK
jgi:putative flippase GtrA